jgi:acyl-coenzyme A thioesterase PaaI-like protein
MSPMQSVTELPFNRFVGIETASDPTQLLRLPAGAQYLNHLGTVHASAQLALAEASSGEFLLRHFGSSGGVVPVVRRLESKFRKPANGAVTSTVSVPPEALEQLGADLAAKGRAIVSVAVELHDESGAHTFSATVEWFITKVPDQAGNAGADTASSA